MRFTLPALCLVLSANAAIMGERPYEMVQAGRTQDDHPALVAFTDTAGWRVETSHAEARLERSQELLLFGDAVAKLTFRATGDNPSVTLIPPAPVAITSAFDAVTCWVYGKSYGYSPDPTTPPVDITITFADQDQKPFSVNLAHIRHKEWFLCHRRLDPAQAERVALGGTLRSITITNGRNTEDRVIYLNSLAVFTEPFAPLTFAPRCQRGVQIFPTCDPGANTGPGTLPFPNTPLTIIPRDTCPSIVRIAKTNEGRYVLTREGEDGKLEICLPSKAGSWDDLAFRWADAGEGFLAGVDGGFFFASDDGPDQRAEREEITMTSDDKSVTYKGKLFQGTRVADIHICFRLIGKSLVMDIQADGGHIHEVRFGALRGLPKPRLVTLPYYTYDGYGKSDERPFVVVSGPVAKPLFFMAHIDWTQSNASMPFSQCMRFDGSFASNGGTRYERKTNGQRNPCFERFVLSLSPRFEDVLPNIPNPPSPWKHVTGTRVWRAHSAYKRLNDAAYWREMHRWGLRQLVVTDHETGWRDNNESFTFRTQPAPGKGGDEGQRTYARIMQDELGFRYGPYNNFTDFAPVNAFWHSDMISRTQDNQLQTAWQRCYAPKPARAVEFCEKLTPIIQKKFGFSTSYCDVHTAVTPWSRVDYDARVPGAGTFAAVYYSYGEIMLIQKKNWNGPVYSEGNNHFSYCGLTDGNYAQDQSYRIAENPWLVDFDLRQMHDLCCNFGMGLPSMFYPGKSEPQDPDTANDRFLAATVAFGHPGFLLRDRTGEMRSYYMIQALGSLYTQTSADTIQYLGSDGTAYDTSAAVANGVYRRSQIITRYADGTVTAVNGNPLERMKVKVANIALDLPPNGYWGRGARDTVRVFSGDVDGHRVDLSVSPDYTYLDGRGKFTRFAEGASAGVAICRTLTNDLVEVLLYKTTEAGFPFAMADAVALDKTNVVISVADVRTARGMSYVRPVAGAFSYRVRRILQPPAILLTCEQETVQPGDRVMVKGQQAYTLTIPEDAKPGDHLWYAFEQGWIDFTVALPAPKTAAAPAPEPHLRLPAWYGRGVAFRGGAEQALESKTGAMVTSATSACGGVSKPHGLFMHPPYRGGAGYAFARYLMDLPGQPLRLRGFVGKQDGSAEGDGIDFKVLVEDAAGKRTEILQAHVAKHEWREVAADLTPWAGQQVSVLLITDTGEKNNSSGDWGAWGDLRLSP